MSLASVLAFHLERFRHPARESGELARDSARPVGVGALEARSRLKFPAQPDRPPLQGYETSGSRRLGIHEVDGLLLAGCGPRSP